MSPPELSVNDTLLTQILTSLTTLGERLAVVEADLKTVIRDHSKDLDDHEQRLRVLETRSGGNITRLDLEVVERKREQHIADAIAGSDRKANLRILWLGVGVSTVVAAVNVIQAIAV